MSRGPFHPGDTCNQYRIIRSLGKGGYGHVYEAVREFKILAAGILQPFGQRVAVKCLQVDQAADPERIERLNLEAVLLLQLKHKNIVGFVDWGIAEEGTAFFAMDLLEGSTLADHLKLRRFSMSRSLYVAAEIAEGMAYAHAKGVTHRDLKPANVFVTDDWEIKVLDLGAAKYQYFWGASTDEGRAPCTVLYAAPEQLSASRDVDSRADVFALGVITYQMLTGRHPFCVDAVTFEEHVVRQSACQAAPLVELGIPRYIADVVHRALAKNPEERGTMDGLLESLRRAYSRYTAERKRPEDDGLGDMPERRELRARLSRNDDTDPSSRIDDDPTDVDVPAIPRARFDGWAFLGTLYERTPRIVGLWAAGLLMLPVGLILVGWPHKWTPEVAAEAKPVVLADPPRVSPPPAAPRIQAPLPALEAPPSEPPLAPAAPVQALAPAAPVPAAPKPAVRKASLYGIHTPKWEAIATPASRKPTLE